VVLLEPIIEIYDPNLDSLRYKNGRNLSLKLTNLGDLIGLKVLGHHKLQDPLHLVIQVQVRRLCLYLGAD
jgi:hypothetical protein